MNPTMTDRPKRSAVTNWEATDKLLDNKKCHPSKQVQQEKQTATTAVGAAEVKKANLATQKKQLVAAFKDQLRREDQQCKKNMACPELVHAHHAVTALSHSFIFLSLNPHADWPIGKIDQATKHPS